MIYYHDFFHMILVYLKQKDLTNINKTSLVILSSTCIFCSSSSVLTFSVEFIFKNFNKLIIRTCLSIKCLSFVYHLLIATLHIFTLFSGPSINDVQYFFTSPSSLFVWMSKPHLQSQIDEINFHTNHTEKIPDFIRFQSDFYASKSGLKSSKIDF